MEMKVTEKSKNPLLERQEIRFEVDHTGEPTPPRNEVMKELSADLGVSPKKIVIEKVATMQGRQIASGIARVYETEENMRELEPSHLIERTEIPEEEIEELEVEKEVIEEEEEEAEEVEEEEEAEPEKEAEEEEAPEKEEEPKEEVDYEELSKQTISDIKDEDDEIDIDYEKLLEAEKNNKNRKTLVQWLESRIEED